MSMSELEEMKKALTEVVKSLRRVVEESLSGTERGASMSPKLVQQESTLWTAAEAARYLKMSKKWVYRKALADEIPCHRFGSRVRFVPSELESWVAAGAPQTPPRVVSMAQR
jgi:excisionase family DNA binding protein